MKNKNFFEKTAISYNVFCQVFLSYRCKCSEFE